MKIGFVGLGQMGKWMAGNIAKQFDTFIPNFHATLDTYGKALDMGLENEDKGAMLKVFEKELEVLFRK